MKREPPRPRTLCRRQLLLDLPCGLQGGGAGFYEASGFVHLDTGRLRGWGDPHD
jgi:hypothetical protein